MTSLFYKIRFQSLRVTSLMDGLVAKQDFRKKILTKMESPDFAKRLSLPFSAEQHHDAQELDGAMAVKTAGSGLRFDWTPTTRNCGIIFLTMQTNIFNQQQVLSYINQGELAIVLLALIIAFTHKYRYLLNFVRQWVMSRRSLWGIFKTNRSNLNNQIPLPLNFTASLTLYPSSRAYKTRIAKKTY